MVYNVVSISGCELVGYSILVLSRLLLHGEGGGEGGFGAGGDGNGYLKQEKRGNIKIRICMLVEERGKEKKRTVFGSRTENNLWKTNPKPSLCTF